MAVIYNTTVKNARMTVVRDAIDAGAAGKLQIATSGFATVLVEFTLQDPSGAVSGGILALTPPSLMGNPTASGTAATARITTSTGTVIVSGLTVGTTGADILLNSAAISVGNPVQITSATITHG
jgi:hypothetical protein